MVDHIYLMVKCSKIGCSRSILYCYKCDNMKEIKNGILTCDWNDKNSEQKIANKKGNEIK
jgi:hypothetical protein